MQNWYEWQGCELIYLPLHQMANVEWNSIRDYLIYQFPVLHNAEFQDVLGTLQEPAHMLVNRLLVQTNLPAAAGKAFLIYTDPALLQSEQPFLILSSYQPGREKVEEFFQAGFKSLWDLQEIQSLNDEVIFYEASSCALENGNDSEELFSKLNFHFKSDQIVTRPDEDIPILSDEIKSQLDRLKKIGNKAAMLDVLIYILNNLNPYFKADHSSVLEMLEKHWAEYAVSAHPSRILIDKHSKVFLPDFGNLEVKMTPLPKTLFLFYLRHPEGVAFKFLSDHREQLEQIYSKITNSSNPARISDSISALVDPTKNSINENCSRVKEAFVSVMHKSIADNYLIKGPKGELKKINLDPNLIIYDIPQLQGCRD